MRTIITRTKRTIWRYGTLLGVAALAASALACGAESDEGAAATATAKAPAATSAATTAATSAASPAAAATGKRQIGSLTYEVRSTVSVAGKTSQEVTMENFAFGPTFIQGTPGSKVSLALKNGSAASHTFTLREQNLDQQVPAGGNATVEVTIPASGGLLFVCRFHTASGMNGQLLAGTIEPVAISQTTSATPASSAATAAPKASATASAEVGY